MQTGKGEKFTSGLVISEEVIATIAANAARDVDGVEDLGNRPADLYTTFNIGAEDLKKVAVTITDYDIKTHVYIVVSSSAKIQEVSADIQEAVKSAIQNMTGRIVTRVDVTVTGVKTDSGEVSPRDLTPVEP